MTSTSPIQKTGWFLLQNWLWRLPVPYLCDSSGQCLSTFMSLGLWERKVLSNPSHPGVVDRSDSCTASHTSAGWILSYSPPAQQVVIPRSKRGQQLFYKTWRFLSPLEIAILGCHCDSVPSMLKRTTRFIHQVHFVLKYLLTFDLYKTLPPLNLQFSIIYMISICQF